MALSREMWPLNLIILDKHLRGLKSGIRRGFSPMTAAEFGLRLAEMLLPILVALLVAIMGYVIAWLKKQTGKIEQDIIQKILESALDEAHRVGRDAIIATNQRFVGDIKSQAEDGKLTHDEAQEAMLRAKEYFMATITRDSLKILENAIGPAEEWLEGFLEAKLGHEKDAQAMVSKLANPT